MLGMAKGQKRVARMGAESKEEISAFGAAGTGVRKLGGEWFRQW